MGVGEGGICAAPAKLPAKVFTLSEERRKCSSLLSGLGPSSADIFSTVGSDRRGCFSSKGHLPPLIEGVVKGLMTLIFSPLSKSDVSIWGHLAPRPLGIKFLIPALKNKLLLV